jgi:small subunit ribosomal protein S1
VEGLVHVSEITWANTPINAKEFFKLSDEHQAKVVTLDKGSRKMSLSIKQLSEDPWSTIETRFAEGSRHTGVVKNITPYGVFVELAPGIGGMIHISDLSWLKRFNHPSEFTKVGADIDVAILAIDKDNRKLQLGHKQLEEDPWNSLQDTFAVGSIHEGTVLRKDDKGALVQLPYGLEGFAPNRHLAKEDGKSVQAEEIAQFMVIEFDRNEKRIVLSHARIWEQAHAEGKRRRPQGSARRSGQNQKSREEHSGQSGKTNPWRLGCAGADQRAPAAAGAERRRRPEVRLILFSYKAVAVATAFFYAANFFKTPCIGSHTSQKGQNSQKGQM